jgi:hypothetical protein
MSRRSLTALLCAAQIGLLALFTVEEGMRAVFIADQDSAVCSNRTGIDVPEAVRSGNSSASEYIFAPDPYSLQPVKAAISIRMNDDIVRIHSPLVPAGGHLFSALSRAPPYV